MVVAYFQRCAFLFQIVAVLLFGKFGRIARFFRPIGIAVDVFTALYLPVNRAYMYAEQFREFLCGRFCFQLGFQFKPFGINQMIKMLPFNRLSPPCV